MTTSRTDAEKVLWQFGYSDKEVKWLIDKFAKSRLSLLLVAVASGAVLPPGQLPEEVYS